MEKYSVSGVWSRVRVRKPEVSWWRVVWSEPTIPSWMLVSFPALSPSSRAANLAWRCMVSHVWKERCRRVFSGQQLDVLQLGRRICWELSSIKCNSDSQQHISLYRWRNQGEALPSHGPALFRILTFDYM
ncbi:hypothetical protein LINGRAHAP2_LOCUS32835 [Linum grandiflorum]